MKMEVPVLPQAFEMSDDFDTGFEPTKPRTKKARREERKYWLSKDRGYRRKGGTMPFNKHVYVVRAANGLLKIGCAFDIELRMDQLQTMSPVKLHLVQWVLHGGVKFERKLHAMLRHRRSHGEWFDATTEEVKMFINALVRSWGKW